jgi:riboflavin biosynthesis pyrimidine reductase
MDRPRVITHNVASIDGRLTLAPGVLLLTGDDRWTRIAGDSDPYARIRATHDPDALLEGSGSFVTDDAPPADHTPPDSEADAGLGDDRYLPSEAVEVEGRRWLVVVDGRGRVRWQFKEWPDPAWAGWHILVLTSGAVSPSHLAWLRAEGIPYIVVGDGPVDLAGALRLLAGELGVRTLVATGGGRLNGALLRAGLVDEVDVEYLPAVIGGRGTPSLFDAPPLTADELPVGLGLLDVQRTDDDHVLVRYSVETYVDERRRTR